MSFRFASQDIGRTVTGTWAVTADSYHNPATYEREKDACLTRTWFIATHSTAVPDDSHIVWEGFDQSIVVTRSGEQLRAFHNVCQHRGARIIAESGPNGSGAFRCRGTAGCTTCRVV